jgi:hypothetical protein
VLPVGSNLELEFIGEVNGQSSLGAKISRKPEVFFKEKPKGYSIAL